MTIASAGNKPTTRVSAFEWTVMLTVAAVMIALSWFEIWPLAMIEVLGFATGGICGWLIVRQDVLNWPIGLANFLVFIVLFYKAQLYADMTVQAIFFIISIYGWWEWMRGGANGQPLAVSRTRRGEWIALAVLIPVCFGISVLLLEDIHDAAPLWDGLTSILSLSAQFLLSRKRIENWYFWITAHSIYIPLYLSRGLPLTALLYVMFLAMCVIGLITWKKEWRSAHAA
jgi:nicotinamide mononucleotide transporter